MNPMRWCAAVVALGLLAGCPKREGAPSPEFEKARDRFLALQATDPLGVFSRPELKDLLPPIDGVAADSVEKGAAVALAKTIRDGIAEAEKDAADRAKAVAAVNKPSAYVAPSGGGFVPTPSSPDPRPAPVATDAGPNKAVDPGPSAGMSQADFSAKYGSCFAKTGVYTDDKGVSGETYVLNSSAACASRLPSMGQQIVMMAGGKVDHIVPQSAVTKSTSFTLGTTNDAPTGAPTAAPAPVAPPPPPAAPPPPVTAAPVLPVPPSDQITTPPADPNVNPNAANP